MDQSLCVRRVTDERDLPRMTRWMHDWWGKAEGYSREAVYARMAHSLQEKRLPQTYGLFLSGQLIGMYQLTMEDLFVRPDLYPWLANVYIDAEHRAQGYGSVLLSSVRASAAQAGFEELYLFTTHDHLYEKFGWIFMEMIDTRLEPRMQRLYRLDVSLSACRTAREGSEMNEIP